MRKEKKKERKKKINAMLVHHYTNTVDYTQITITELMQVNIKEEKTEKKKEKSKLEAISRPVSVFPSNVCKK